jgi:PAS domain S-box-containing protein
MLSDIHRHYSERLTLARFARNLRRPPASLGRLFREEIGVTVHEYVTRARMVFSAADVRAGVKVEAVALVLGYRSKKNFYRQFKRFFGMTPDIYRRDHGASAATDRLRDDRPRRVRDRPVSDLKEARTLADSRTAMLLTDEHGRYVGASETAIALTGYSIDELRGMPAEVLFPHASGSNTRSRLQLLLSASASVPSTTVLHTKSAGRVPVHLTSVENVLGALAHVERG